MAERPPALLSVRELSVAYGDTLVVDRVSFDIAAGECLGLAGESGSGKSTLAHALLRTLPEPASIVGGRVQFGDVDVCAASYEDMRRIRGNEIAVVFQSALNALNPVLTVGAQIDDVIQSHRSVSRREALALVRETLSAVGLDESCANKYPHQLSGGMRQRAVLAIALCLKPRLLVLDEPTTALDVLTQRAVLDRLKALRSEFQFGLLFVTHDLPLLFEFADRILVLYAGRCAELGSPETLARDARHPYTRALIQSVPDWLPDQGPAVGIPGNPPSLDTPPTGCRFHPRCSRAQASCREQHPEPRSDGERLFACHHPWS